MPDHAGGNASRKTACYTLRAAELMLVNRPRSTRRIALNAN